MAKVPKVKIDRIQDIIKEHMEVLMRVLVGSGNPPRQLLKDLGLNNTQIDLIGKSYKYGRLRILSNKDLSKLSLKQIDDLLRNLRLTPAQKQSVEYLKMKAQQSIDNLTQKITSSTTTTIIQSSTLMWQGVDKIVVDALQKRISRDKVIQQLRDYTNDWERDWHRVAQTEMWDAKLHGEAIAILQDESPFSTDGADTIVFKRPAPNCCHMCEKLYLEKDKKTPKTFKLGELLSNGNNYGLKQADWKPTLGVLHPNCQCVLNVKPKNTKFNDKGELVPDI